MAKKAVAPKKPVAKKAVASAKVVPKVSAKSEVKTKAKPEVKKPTVMAAQKPAKKEAAPPKVQKVEPPVAPKAKPPQHAETTEKIKIDREKMTEDQIKWAEMYNKYRDAQAAQYDMKSTFKSGAPIQHKVLGWGWIVSNENDRLEVLFKDGKRMLISNYRG